MSPMRMDSSKNSLRVPSSVRSHSALGFFNSRASSINLQRSQTPEESESYFFNVEPQDLLFNPSDEHLIEVFGSRKFHRHVFLRVTRVPAPIGPGEASHITALQLEAATQKELSHLLDQKLICLSQGLKIIMMNLKYNEPIPAQHNSIINTLIENYHGLKREIAAKDEEIAAAHKSTQDVQQELESKAAGWEMLELAYKKEIKDLEILLSRKKGLEKVMIQRSGSVLRSQAKHFRQSWDQNEASPVAKGNGTIPQRRGTVIKDGTQLKRMSQITDYKSYSSPTDKIVADYSAQQDCSLSRSIQQQEDVLGNEMRRSFQSLSAIERREAMRGYSTSSESSDEAPTTGLGIIGLQENATTTVTDIDISYRKPATHGVANFTKSIFSWGKKRSGSSKPSDMYVDSSASSESSDGESFDFLARELRGDSRAPTLEVELEPVNAAFGAGLQVPAKIFSWARKKSSSNLFSLGSQCAHASPNKDKRSNSEVVRTATNLEQPTSPRRKTESLASPTRDTFRMTVFEPMYQMMPANGRLKVEMSDPSPPRRRASTTMTSSGASEAGVAIWDRSMISITSGTMVAEPAIIDNPTEVLADTHNTLQGSTRKPQRYQGGSTKHRGRPSALQSRSSSSSGTHIRESLDEARYPARVSSAQQLRGSQPLRGGMENTRQPHRNSNDGAHTRSETTRPNDNDKTAEAKNRNLTAKIRESLEEGPGPARVPSDKTHGGLVSRPRKNSQLKTPSMKPLTRVATEKIRGLIDQYSGSDGERPKTPGPFPLYSSNTSLRSVSMGTDQPKEAMEPWKPVGGRNVSLNDARAPTRVPSDHRCRGGKRMAQHADERCLPSRQSSNSSSRGALGRGNEDDIGGMSPALIAARRVSANQSKRVSSGSEVSKWK